MTGAWNTLPAKPKPTSPTSSNDLSLQAGHELGLRQVVIGEVACQDFHSPLARR